MKLVSVNRGKTKRVQWGNTEVETGIYKYSVKGYIWLDHNKVKDDSIVDSRHHGGEQKAVYAYGVNHYPYWVEQFPDLDWGFGMFGENLTIERLEETDLKIGSVYNVGEAQIQVSEPRQPCFKLGIRFQTQSILKTFLNSTFCGSYFRVLRPGMVMAGHELIPISIETGSPTVSEVYSLIYHKEKNADSKITKAMSCNLLSDAVKSKILKTQT